MNRYRTAEIAEIIGIHPNTVRLYEKLELISKPHRRENGYRIFTELHIQQFQLARLAFQIEVLQNGLRKKIVQMIKTAATGDFDTALFLTREYLKQVREERNHAEEAAKLAEQLLAGKSHENTLVLKRKEVSEYLGISMDTLRNWELNGLLVVKRKKNGYRVYTDDDIRRLKIIRSLRCANYSLEAILHMLCQLSTDTEVDILRVLDTPNEDTDIITVCDKLITSLLAAENNALQMIDMLQNMKITYS